MTFAIEIEPCWNYSGKYIEGEEIMNTIKLISLSLLLALVLGGCFKGTATELTVDMQEFMFDPVEFTIPAGQEISLTLTNNGAVEHEFVIMKYGFEVSVPFDDNDEDNIYWEHEVEAGGTATVTFTAPSEPGEYQIVCGIAGHLEAGMLGKLTVLAP